MAAPCCTCLGITRILCYTCCCCRCLRSPKPHHHDTFNVLCLGLQGAGKSTMLAALQGEGLEDTQPTKGFSIKVVQTRRATLSVKELGGGPEVIEYWRRYYEGQDGIIVVVDATKTDSLARSCSAMKEHLEDPRITSLPCMMLLNKKDKKLKDDQDTALLEDLGVTELANRPLRFVRVCSAVDERTLRGAVEEFANTLQSTCTKAAVK